MRSYSSLKDKTPAKAAFIDFAFRILVPSIPLIGISLAAIYLMNADITGTYKGISPKTGSVVLILEERKGSLTGEMILKDRLHLPITDGHMTGEQKLELLFRAVPSRRRLQKNNSLIAPTFIGTHNQNTIEGLFSYDNLEIQLKLKRGATSTFFSRRWFDRFVDYFGGNSQ